MLALKLRWLDSHLQVQYSIRRKDNSLFLRGDKKMVTELQKGIRIEKEHSKTINKIINHYKLHGKMPSNKQVSKMIAKDHLKEDPKYYTKLARLRL